MFTIVKHNGLLVNKDFLELLRRNSLDDRDRLFRHTGGTTLKKNRFRSVTRLDIEGDGDTRELYLKRHFWPWQERVRAFIPFAAREDARNEWKNMLLLHDLGFRTMVPVAFGEKKRWGLPCLSLTVTEGIQGAEKLEAYLPARFSPSRGNSSFEEKRAVIRKLANFAREFHAKGLNHQDFYLGHLFFRQKDGAIIIVDIQRVHRRGKIRTRARIKDLAQLTFSAKSLGIFTAADFMRFVHVYLGVRKVKAREKRLIRRILSKVSRIDRHTVRLLERRRKGT